MLQVRTGLELHRVGALVYTLALAGLVLTYNQHRLLPLLLSVVLLWLGPGCGLVGAVLVFRALGARPNTVTALALLPLGFVFAAMKQYPLALTCYFISALSTFAVVDALGAKLDVKVRRPASWWLILAPLILGLAGAPLWPGHPAEGFIATGVVASLLTQPLVYALILGKMARGLELAADRLV